MSAEKRLQKILNKVNKGTGNTTEATDSRGEIQEALTASGKGNLVRRGKRLYEKINKGKGITMVSPLGFKGANSSNSECWSNKVKIGTKPSPTRPGVTVNDCVDPSSPRAKNKKK